MRLSTTCVNCAKSKVRCLRGSDNSDVCARCCRLGKECRYRETGRRFYGFQKDRQIEALESRVNELVANRGLGSVSTRSPGVGSPSIADGLDASGKDVVDRGLLNMESAQYFLDVFRTQMAVHFPFVVIPPGVAAVQVREEKPFLFLAVLASASYSNMPLQRLLGTEIKKVISTRMVLNGDVSFDLLQGLLVFLAWSHYHSRPHRYTQFLQLAIALLVELRLDRPPQTKTWKTALRFKQEFTFDNAEYVRPSWGHDEQRAVVGCYYLSSTIAVLLHKPSTFPEISAYLEECCRSLYDTGEHPHDKCISYLFQLQVIAEKINGLSWKHSSSSVAELYISTIKSDLQRLQNQLPISLNESPVLAMQFHTSELCLYQLSLLQQETQLSRAAHFSVSQTWWDDIFCAGLTAAEDIINLYLSLPTACERGFNNTQWVQMAFCLLVASRQIVVASRMRPTALLSRTDAWLETVASLRERVGSLSTTEVDMNCDRDVFFDFEKRVSRIQGWFSGYFERTDTPSNYPGGAVLGGAGLAIDPGLALNISTTPEYPPGHESLATLGGDFRWTQDIFSPGSIDQMIGDWM
ncbi:hypothetical protein BBP40_005491 [Aspergillus hancockii]|nr:hypothetical protein BBP40_005491 [Aspergillus hancockii]